METPSVDLLCKMYLRMRNAKQELAKKMEEEIEAIDKEMQEVALLMKDQLIATGGTSLKTPHGTVYLQNKTKYYPMDWHAFGEWVVQRGAIELLEKRVSQANMKRWLEDTPTDVPPGLNAETEVTVTVRKN
jgi:hypothetical protein